MAEDGRKIIDKILDDARKNSQEIISHAQEQAQEKIDAAKKRGKSKKNRIVEEAIKTSEQEKKRSIAEAKIKARTIILESKEKLIQEAFEVAEKEIETISKRKNYPEILKKTVRDTCVEMGGGELEIIARADDKGILEKELKNLQKEVSKATKDSSLKLSASNVNPGVIIRNTEGGVEIDSTFKNRLELLRPELRLAVSEALFK